MDIKQKAEAYEKMAERSRATTNRYKQRQKERGFVQAMFWIPKENLEEVKNYVKKLKEKK